MIYFSLRETTWLQNDYEIAFVLVPSTHRIQVTLFNLCICVMKSIYKRLHDVCVCKCLLLVKSQNVSYKSHCAKRVIWAKQDTQAKWDTWRYGRPEILVYTNSHNKQSRISPLMYEAELQLRTMSKEWDRGCVTWQGLIFRNNSFYQR